MFKLFQNIFGSINGSDVISRIDDWGLTKEERIKYQLEWIRTLPTGFQLAQRFIGIAFSVVFLLMILVTFIMLTFNLNVQEEIEFIVATMAKPIMIIFSLFFGGGLVDSIRRKSRRFGDSDAISNPKVLEEESDEAIEEELTRREERQLRRQERRNERQERREERREERASE